LPQGPDLDGLRGGLCRRLLPDEPFADDSRGDESAAGLSFDGRWLLYTQLDQFDRDIMLVEHFR
jgi:hypothetical protein